MSEERWDDALKERFDQLKAEDRVRVPDFAQMYARAQEEASALAGDPVADTEVIPLMAGRRRGVWRRWPLAAGTLAAAALAGILLLQPDNSVDVGDDEFEALVTAFAAGNSTWRSPTDGLLAVPGIELLNSVPVIGGPFGSPLDVPGSPPADGDAIG